MIQESFYNTLPELPEVPKEEADIAWFLYDLIYDEAENQYHLTLVRIVYTEFNEALNVVITPRAGDVEKFINVLQSKLDAKQSVSPDKPGTILEFMK